jgi:predicted aspartyl protease
VTTRRVAIALVLAAVAAVAAPAGAQVYRWTDDDGIMYLTTDPSRIPEKYRAKTDKLEASPREPVDSLSSGHVMRTTPGSAIYADAHLNGVPVKLLIDTGATRTVIATGVLARAGLDLTKGNPVSMTGVGGAVRAVEIEVPRLDVAGTQIGPLRVVAYDIAGLRGDGLLGRDVLEQFTLTIDPVRGRATLSR